MTASSSSRQMRDAAVRVNPEIIVLCHGGPIAEPEDAAYVLERTEGVVGFFGASSMERLPTETAMTENMRRFKSHHSTGGGAMSQFIRSGDVRVEPFEWGTIGWRLVPAAGAEHLVVMDVTLVAGGGHDFHRHPGQEEMIIVKRGRSPSTSSRTAQLAAGDSVFLEAGVVHASFNALPARRASGHDRPLARRRDRLRDRGGRRPGALEPPSAALSAHGLPSAFSERSARTSRASQRLLNCIVRRGVEQSGSSSGS